MDKYSEVRRDVFLNVVNPTTQANIRRLYENDPEKAHETDPFLKKLRAATSSDQQKMRGMRKMAVDMKEIINNYSD